MSTINKNERLLRVLTESSTRMRKAIISNASKNFINTLLNCIKVVIKNYNKLSTTDLEAIKKHSKSVTKILTRKKTITDKKKILQQGGFLSAILPVLGNILTGIFKQ